MYFQNEQNTLSVSYPRYEDNELFLFQKPKPTHYSRPAAIRGSLVRKEEYQRVPFQVAEFNFETGIPRPLGLPSDRLAQLLDTRKKTPAEVRELVKGIVDGPAPDIQNRFQRFVYDLYTKMTSGEYGYSKEHALKLIQDLVSKQPELMDANPSSKQIQKRQAYIDTILPYISDDTASNRVEVLPTLDDTGATEAELKEAISKKFHPTELTAAGSNVATFDRNGGIPPSYMFLLDKQALSESFLCLVDFDYLEKLRSMISTNIITPKEIYDHLTTSVYSVFYNNKSAGSESGEVSNLRLSKDGATHIFYLDPARSREERQEMCKTLLITAMTYHIEQSSHSDRISSYRRMLSWFNSIDFSSEGIKTICDEYIHLLVEVVIPEQTVIPRETSAEPPKEEKKKPALARRSSTGSLEHVPKTENVSTDVVTTELVPVPQTVYVSRKPEEKHSRELVGHARHDFGLPDRYMLSPPKTWNELTFEEQQAQLAIDFDDPNNEDIKRLAYHRQGTPYPNKSTLPALEWVTTPAKTGKPNLFTPAKTVEIRKKTLPPPKDADIVPESESAYLEFYKLFDEAANMSITRPDLPVDVKKRMDLFDIPQLVDIISGTLRAAHESKAVNQITEGVYNRRIDARSNGQTWFLFLADLKDPGAHILRPKMEFYLKRVTLNDWLTHKKLPTHLKAPRTQYKHIHKNDQRAGGIASKSLGHILHKFAAPGEDYPISRSLGSVLAKARQPPSVIQSLAKKPKL